MDSSNLQPRKIPVTKLLETAWRVCTMLLMLLMPMSQTILLAGGLQTGDFEALSI